MWGIRRTYLLIKPNQKAWPWSGKGGYCLLHASTLSLPAKWASSNDLDGRPAWKLLVLLSWVRILMLLKDKRTVSSNQGISTGNCLSQSVSKSLQPNAVGTAFIFKFEVFQRLWNLQGYWFSLLAFATAWMRTHGPFEKATSCAWLRPLNWPIILTKSAQL